MTNWREHNGGPQPVADDVWVEVSPETPWDGPAKDYFWSEPVRYRILNQHLIDAARKDGFEAGMEKSAAIADSEGRQNIVREADDDLIAAARLEGIRLGLEAAHKAVADPDVRFIAARRAANFILALNPETIAREGLTKPAQSDLPPSSSDTIPQEAHND